MAQQIKKSAAALTNVEREELEWLRMTMSHVKHWRSRFVAQDPESAGRLAALDAILAAGEKVPHSN